MLVLLIVLLLVALGWRGLLALFVALLFLDGLFALAVGVAGEAHAINAALGVLAIVLLVARRRLVRASA